MSEITKKVIGIQGIITQDFEGDPIICVKKEIADAVHNAGCIPTIIFPHRFLSAPKSMTDEEGWETYHQQIAQKEAYIKKQIGYCDATMIQENPDKSQQTNLIIDATADFKIPCLTTTTNGEYINDVSSKIRNETMDSEESQHKMLRIGVLVDPTRDINGNEVYCVYEDYAKMIQNEGHVPAAIIPPPGIKYRETKIKDLPQLNIEDDKYTEDKEKINNQIDLCDGIILQGGYKMYPHAKYVVDYATEKDVPILATCLGMQTVAAKNYEHADPSNYPLIKMSEELAEIHKNPGVKEAHAINIIPHSWLSRLLGENKIKVNSRHRMKINNNQFNYTVYPFSNARPIAFDASPISLTEEVKIIDEKTEKTKTIDVPVIEAIEFPGKRIIAVQWHVESGYKNGNQNDIKIFRYFLELCADKEKTLWLPEDPVLKIHK